MSLYNVRKQLNMTQAEFSSACGLSLRSIQAYEQGRKLKPPTAHLIAFNLTKYSVNNKSLKIVIPVHCETYDRCCYCYVYLYFFSNLTKQGESKCS